MPALLPSELPVRAVLRNHWITMFELPQKWLGITLLVLLVAGIVDPNPLAFVFVAIIAALGFVRWQTWQSECVVITGKRIVRYEGVPETTAFEASLRLDRISGAVLEKTVPGKILGYGTIELEAPGDHPDIRVLKKMADPEPFYLLLRSIVFGESAGTADPDDVPPRVSRREFDTAELPVVPPGPPWRDRFGRRRG